jgi:hypothetical protein
VGVYTLSFVVVVIVWAPFSFEVKDEEVWVLVKWYQVVDKSHLDIFNRVGKGAIVLVLALGQFVWVTVAKLSLVLILVVKSLHSIMSSLALLLLWTSISVSELA